MTRNKRDNGDGCIRKTSDGKWTARIQIGKNSNGKPHIKAFYGKTEAEVKKKLRNFKKEMNASTIDSMQKVSFGVYILDWLQSYKKNLLKPSSYDRLENTIKHYILPDLEFIQLSQINSDDIQNVINKIYKQGLSQSSIKKVYNAINGCLSHAQKKRNISYNPCLTVYLPSKSKFDKKTISIYSKSEIEKIKKECVRKYKTGTDVYYKGEIFIFILNTGLRMGEALALTWDDFDEDKQIIHINKNVIRIKKRDEITGGTMGYQNIIQNYTKTASGERIIPLNKTALDIILTIKNDKTLNNSKYIFSTSKGEVMTSNALTKKFNKILANCNIDKTGVHTLRHTFASLLFSKNRDVKEVSELLGHSNVSITYNTYIHLLKEHKRDAVNSIDDL